MKLESLDYLCCPACNGSFELTNEEVTGSDVIQGELKCCKCNRHFEIGQGLANLIFPEKLEESDSRSQKFYDGRARWYDIRNRLALLRMGAWDYFFMQNRVMRSLINNLELKKGSSILETGTGTGNALSIISKQIGQEGHLHASDISSGMLKIAQKRAKTKKIRAELMLANASYLPYRTGVFDAVFHVGGWNTFSNKQRAMSEMLRVAKSRANIIIADEGLEPGKEKTRIGKAILKRDKEGLYLMKPPLELLPNNIEDLKINWGLNGVGWDIKFRKI